MNPNPSTPHPDARIDHVLNALRSTQAPTGLEERVAERVTARLAQSSSSRSFLAVILSAASRNFMRDAQSKDPRISLVPARLYILAALILLPTCATIALYSHRTPHTLAQSNPIPTKPYTASQPTATPTNPTQLSSTTNPHPHRSLSPAQTTSISTPATTPSDPDTIALAETLAPSHPAPPLPLTQQELLLLKATQKGAPIEVAELSLANEPAFRTATEARREAHQDANIRRFAQSLFTPIAIAASLESTTQDAEPSTPTPAPTPSN